MVKFDLGGDRFFMVLEDKIGVHEAEDARLLCELENPKQKRVLCVVPGEVSFYWASVILGAWFWVLVLGF